MAKNVIIDKLWVLGFTLGPYSYKKYSYLDRSPPQSPLGITLKKMIYIDLIRVFGVRAKRGQRNGPLKTSNPKKPIPLLVALLGMKGEG
jgi:hypothetical protein